MKGIPIPPYLVAPSPQRLRMFGIGLPEPVDRRALRLALLFEIESEAFDRTLPGRFSTRDQEVWMLAPGRSLSMSRDFSERLKRRILDYCIQESIPVEDVARARPIAERMTFSRQVQLADELDRAVGQVFTLPSDPRDRPNDARVDSPRLRFRPFGG